MERPECCWRLVTDIICLLIVGLPILIFKLAVTPYQRGYFPDDESIRLPYKESTISDGTLIVVGLSIPILAIVIIQCHKFRQGADPEKRSSLSNGPVPTLCRKQVPALMYAIYCDLFVFGFGCCACQLLTDIGKYSIGRLRPHFISICHPRVLDGAVPLGQDYVTNYRCDIAPGFTESDIREGRLSFPSGHASLSAYTMVFLVLYLHSKVSIRRPSLLQPLLQYLAVAVAFYTALSRVSDYKHHWSDVLAGSVLGTTIACLTVLGVSDFFKKKKLSRQDEEMAMPLSTTSTTDRSSYSRNNTPERGEFKEIVNPNHSR